MKRVLKIILPFVLIAAVFVLYNSGLLSENSYSDTQGHWAGGIIKKWSDRGVITGNDGLFRPSDGVTRAEMCTIISRIAPLPEPAADEYSDVEEGQWFAPVMLRCVAAGVLEPENGLLQPDKKLSRQEALDMLLRALGVEEAQGMELLYEHYRADASSNNFGYDDELVVDDTLKDIKAASLDPEGLLSRAELVLMLDACQAKGYLNME